MASAKLRPSLSVDQLSTLKECVETKLAILSKDMKPEHYGKISELIELRKYIETFIASSGVQSKQDIINQYLAEQKMHAIIAESPMPAVIKEGAINAPESNPAELKEFEETFTNILTNPMLNDDQRYDIIKMKKENTLTEEEKIWLLNVGTMILIKRQSKGTIKEGDL